MISPKSCWGPIWNFSPPKLTRSLSGRLSTLSEAVTQVSWNLIQWFSSFPPAIPACHKYAPWMGHFHFMDQLKLFLLRLLNNIKAQTLCFLNNLRCGSLILTLVTAFKSDSLPFRSPVSCEACPVNLRLFLLWVRVCICLPICSMNPDFCSEAAVWN